MKTFEPDAIRRAVGFPELIEPVARSLADFSSGLGEAPISVFAPAGAEDDVQVKSAWMPGRSFFTVKVATWFAAGRPAAGGYIAVHDAVTGELLAFLRDGHHLERVLIWGRRPEAAQRLRAALEARLPVSVEAQAEHAVRQADVIVTATGSRQPIVRGEWLRPGQHVRAVGADDLTKAELDPARFHRADVLVVDSRADALRFAGDLRAASITAADPPASAVDLGRRRL